MENEVVPNVAELERRAFDDVCKRLRPRLKAQACRLVGLQEADDVVQQALLTAWSVRMRINLNSTDGEMFAWLSKFITFTAREQRRIAARRRGREAPTDTVPIPDDFLQLYVPDTATARQELYLIQRRELLRLLCRVNLTNRQRDCVRSWASGESQHAIAARLHLRSATVWQHIGAAIDKMQQLERDTAYTARTAYFHEQGRRGYTAPEPIGARLAREQLAKMAHHDSLVAARCRRRRIRWSRSQDAISNVPTKTIKACSKESATDRK